LEEIKDLLRGMIDQTKYILLKLEGDHYPYKASVIGDKATKDITDMNNAVKNVASRTRTDSSFLAILCPLVVSRLYLVSLLQLLHLQQLPVLLLNLSKMSMMMMMERIYSTTISWMIIGEWMSMISMSSWGWRNRLRMTGILIR
jgi:hypothetical protein